MNGTENRKPNAPGVGGAAADMDAVGSAVLPQYSTPRQEAHAFLRALWGDEPPFELMLYYLPKKTPTWHTTIDGAARAAISAAARQNVYTPVGLQRTRPPKGERGKADGVCALAGLWADIDYQSPAHKAQNLPPDEAAARVLLAELPLSPTVVVHSGHGLQAWWLWRGEVWAFDSEAERLAAADLAERWQATVQAAAARHGWAVDAVADLARLLRLPGTVNRKPDCEPVPVRLLRLGANRYTRDDFEPFLVDTPDSRGNGRKPDSPRQISLVVELPRAAAALARLSPNRADDYTTWIHVGMALSELGQSGLELWRDWSQQSTRYKPGDCETKWRTWEPGQGITLASLYHWEREDSSNDDTHELAGQKLSNSATANEAPDATEPDKALPVHLTDLGNARRLVRRHGHDLRYCEALGGWLCWDGRRWATDTTGKAVRKAKETVRAMYAEAGKEANEERRKALAKWALGSESAPRIAAMLELARTELEVVAEAGDFDADPWLFNCHNGTIDLRTGELRPHNRQDLITKLAPVDFEPNLTDPLFEKYLSDATGGDSDFAAYLQRAVGYTLTGVTDTEDVFLLLGEGNSGKTTLVEAMLHTWGDYGHKASFTTFLARNAPLGEGDPPRADLVQMRGARLVAASEPEKGRRLAASTVKELSGGDQVNARLPYAKQAVTYMPTFKLWLAANKAPVMDDDDSGLWRRLKDLAFTKVVPEEKRDPALKRHLQTGGRAAVLAWAVRGCLAWQQEGLHPPRLVRTATSELRSSFDPLADFFEECCYFAPDVWVSAKALREAYVAWAKDMKARPISHKEWGTRLRASGCEPGQRKDSTGHNRKTWEGVTLQSTLVTDVTDEAVVSSNF